MKNSKQNKSCCPKLSSFWSRLFRPKKPTNSDIIEIKADGLCFFRAQLVCTEEDLLFAQNHSTEKVKAIALEKYKNEIRSSLGTAIEISLLDKISFKENSRHRERSEEENKKLLIEALEDNLPSLWQPTGVAKVLMLLDYDVTMTYRNKRQFKIDALEHCVAFSNTFFTAMNGELPNPRLVLKDHHYTLLNYQPKQTKL